MTKKTITIFALGLLLLAGALGGYQWHNSQPTQATSSISSSETTEEYLNRFHGYSNTGISNCKDDYCDGAK